MDANSEMDQRVIDGCFEQGFMGLDVPEVNILRLLLLLFKIY